MIRYFGSVQGLKQQTQGLLLGLGSGNATSGDIVLNKTATVDSGQITGIMPENGALNYSLPINGTYNIPSGHTTGGSITQSIPTLSAQTYTPGANPQTISAGQYLTGDQTIAGVTIESLGGKQYASGTGTTDANSNLTISGLSFTPNMIVVTAQNAGANTYYQRTYNGNITDYSYLNTLFTIFTLGTSTLTNSFVLSPFTINNGGFVCSFYNLTNWTCNWVVYE